MTQSLYDYIYYLPISRNMKLLKLINIIAWQNISLISNYWSNDYWFEFTTHPQMKTDVNVSFLVISVIANRCFIHSIRMYVFSPNLLNPIFRHRRMLAESMSKWGQLSWVNGLLQVYLCFRLYWIYLW